MPMDEVTLEFQLLPLYLGRHNLPELHLIDRAVNPDAMKLQVRKLTDPAYLNTIKDQRVEYLIKGFTKRVLVQN